jgi:hypothetical protein
MASDGGKGFQGELLLWQGALDAKALEPVPKRNETRNGHISQTPFHNLGAQQLNIRQCRLGDLPDEIFVRQAFEIFITHILLGRVCPTPSSAAFKQIPLLWGCL